MEQTYIDEIRLSRALAIAVGSGEQELISAALSDLQKHYQKQIEEGVQ